MAQDFRGSLAQEKENRIWIEKEKKNHSSDLTQSQFSRKVKEKNCWSRLNESGS